MINLMENQIRRIIREVLEELIVIPHFNHRVKDRLTNPLASFSEEKQSIQDYVKKKIKELKEIDFPGQDNIAVKIYQSKAIYKYKAISDHSEGSGNTIWAIIRGNDLDTLLLNMGTNPKNTQIQIPVETLLKYIDEVKGGDKNLTDKDIRRIRSGDLSPHKEIEQEPKEPIFVIDGVKYVYNPEKKVLVQKNNPDKSDKWINLDDAFEMISQKQQEELLAIV